MSLVVAALMWAAVGADEYVGASMPQYGGADYVLPGDDYRAAPDYKYHADQLSGARASSLSPPPPLHRTNLLIRPQVTRTYRRTISTLKPGKNHQEKKDIDRGGQGTKSERRLSR